MAKTIQEVLDMAKDIELVDIRFVDPGTWQHFTIPAHRLSQDFFENGIPLMAHPFAVSRRSTSQTCSSKRTRIQPLLIRQQKFPHWS